MRTRMKACEICCHDSKPSDFVKCENDHKLCSSCFSKVKYCPFCRADKATFVDSAGGRIWTPCRNRLRHGCDGELNHECPFELLNRLSRIERNYLLHILTTIYNIDNPIFVWGPRAIPVLSRLRRSWEEHVDLWNSFLDCEELRVEVFNIINV